jgi:hypothetical protein
VLIEQVDGLDVEPLQGELGRRTDPLRPAVDPGSDGILAIVETEFRGDDDAVEQVPPAASIHFGAKVVATLPPAVGE